MATSIRLDEETEKRLDALARKTGRTKAWYLRLLIAEHLEDLEDYYLAAHTAENVRRGKERIFGLEDLERELGLEG